MAEQKEKRYHELLDKLQTKLTGWFEVVLTRVRNNRTKDLVLLTLPYQVAAVVTALVAVGYAWLFKKMEGVSMWLFTLDPRLVFLMSPLCFLKTKLPHPWSSIGTYADPWVA